MAVDLNGIIEQGKKVEHFTNKIVQLAKKAKVAYVKADGTPVAPAASTIADIKAQAAILVPLKEAADAAMAAAYTP